jgi:acyl-CoA synthetase (AMP-forming)/AMP-acid ligase II/thioesterase domain-containing protein/acyl carrier protein
MLRAYPVAQAFNVPEHLCLHHLLQDQAQRIPDAPAIVASGRAALTFGRLHTHVAAIAQTLHAMGLGRNDRIALALPNGPELAVAFLAVAASATCAPLNPTYGSDEFDFYLADLHAKALIVQAETYSPSRVVAHAHGLRIIELSPMIGAEAGLFTLTSEKPTSEKSLCTARRGFAKPGDMALVLHTSGTTSRPKIVPLTHINICTSAHNTRVALALTENDRCLNVPPLFHVHGLIGAMLPSLMAGASVLCTPGFSAPEFFAWMSEFRPTWYTAVPAIHQAILACATLYREIVAGCPLRFIRSSSASLPPRLLKEADRVFNAPMIEFYGMTETLLTTSNPLPPHERKIGSVGIAAGPEVAIMDEGGTLLRAGKIGEIVVRGATVFQGYENDPLANGSAFTKGWFRTGDQGYLDDDGYLFITGRLKEIINRGGEKIAPQEVDEVLMNHPAVAQAATFAVPHARLAEDVAAAVVLRPNASATVSDIRQFAATRLADFKIPRQVIIVDDIPKSPTGKLHRLGLAEKFGLVPLDQGQPAGPADYAAPRTPVEDRLARLWAEVLDVEHVGIHDNFFNLGGDSLLAVNLFVQIEKAFGKNFPLATLLKAPTVEQLASMIRQEGWTMSWSSLVPIQPLGPNPPFFCVHGSSGNAIIFRDLARHLGSDQPFYGLQAQGLDGKQAPYTQVEEMAAHYIREILTVQPEGPFLLGGFCFGGLVAFEMARQLQRQGHKIVLPILFETYRHPTSLSTKSFFRYKIDCLKLFMAVHLRNLLRCGPKEMTIYLWEGTKRRFKKRRLRIENKSYQLLGHHLPSALRGAADNNLLAARAYRPKVYHGRIVVFLDSETPIRGPHDPAWAWGELATGGLEVHRVPGKHGDIFREPHVRVLAEKLRAYLDKAQANELREQI